MSLTITKVLGVAIGGLLAAASVSSCVANDASLVILGVLTPPLSSGTTGASVCLYTPNIVGPYLSFGTMDVAFAEEYVPTLLVGNQLVPEGNGSQARIETNNIILQGAIVRVTDATGAQLDNYTAPADGFVLPSSGGTPGLSTIAVTLVSPKAADAVRQSLGTAFGTKRLISFVKVFGTTTGGTHLESGEVGIPINACNGCLVIFPAGSDDPAQTKQPNCALTTGGTGTVSTPCLFGQDQYIDCRLCQGNVACDPSLR